MDKWTGKMCNATAIFASKMSDNTRDKHSNALDSLLGSALEVLAPNSLQINEHEFQRYVRNVACCFAVLFKRIHMSDAIVALGNATCIWGLCMRCTFLP